MLEAHLCFVNLKINAGALEEEGQFTGNKRGTKGTLVWRWKNIMLSIKKPLFDTWTLGDEQNPGRSLSGYNERRKRHQINKNKTWEGVSISLD